MQIRVPLVVIPALLLAGFVLFVTVAAALVLKQPLTVTPTEPLTFDHSVHVGIAGLDCTFCHRTADKTYTPGLPDVQQCMFCHAVVQQVQQAPAQYAEDLTKLRTAWQNQTPIDWVRVHRMPDHVHFVHAPHIQAGLQCADCHGDVGNKSGQVSQVRALNMGDCLSCHKDRGALTECVACHY